MPTDPARVQAVFLAAVDLADPTARATYLDRECAGDTSLRARVDALLRSVDQPDSLLDAPIAPAAGGETQTLPAAAADDTADALAFLAPPGRPDSLGRLGHYEVLEVLGRGGFGIVYRAFDDTLQRVVAVKVLAPSLAVTSPARKRFLREAQSAARIQHENVVRIIEIGEEPLPYLVMEFIAGETLQERLDRTGPLDVREVLRIGRQIAAGLAAAHATGLIHRDIKPSNILIGKGPDEPVKITDFGLARAADDASLTRSGTVAGTPLYMAPEQARGETLDHRADLFSLGSVLYAMLTGRPPFRASGTLAVLKRVAEDDPRPMREVIPEVPDWLCRIVDTLHAKDPAARYQNAREVAEVLADCEAQLAAHGTLRDFSRIPGGRATRRRVPRWASAAAAAIVVVLVVGFWFGRPARLYVTNQGELELVPQDGLVSLIVLQNDDGVYDGNKLDPMVTDWLSMKTAHTLKLPAGRYQINAGLAPPGPNIVHWEVTMAGPAGSKRVLMPGLGHVGWSVIVTVGRGERVSVRPVLGQAPSPPTTNPPAAEAGWVQLFNGKDLTGWKAHPTEPGEWKVVDSKLVGRPGRAGYLFSDRGDYRNFHLRAEVKLNAGGDSGVFVRAALGPMIDGKRPEYIGKKSPPGYEAQVCNDASPLKTGSLFLVQEGSEPAVAREDRPLVRPGEWCRLEVLADGPWVTVKVNGERTASLKNETYARGHIALQMWNDGTEVVFRKIEIQELPAAPGAASPPPAAASTFLLVGSDGAAGPGFATLAEAVEAAPAGGTVEVRGNGPFVTVGLTAKKAVTIRAGVGFRPVLDHDPNDRLNAALVTASNGLTLEGLELRDTGGLFGRPRILVNVAAGSFAAANCRFVSAGALTRAVGAPRVDLRNCEFLSAWIQAAAVNWTGPPSKGVLRMANCVSPNWGLFLNPSQKELEDVRLDFHSNTLTGAYLMSLYSDGELLGDGKRPPPFRVTAAGNVLQVPSLFRVEINSNRTAAANWPLERVDHLARAALHWTGERNVYLPTTGYELWHGDDAGKMARAVKSRAAWKEGWGASDTGGLEAAVRFFGPTRRDGPTGVAEINPDNFRLAVGSPGLSAGSGGKDLGADVTLVGPGAAYERWKKTPDHRDWAEARRAGDS